MSPFVSLGRCHFHPLDRSQKEVKSEHPRGGDEGVRILERLYAVILSPLTAIRRNDMKMAWTSRE